MNKDRLPSHPEATRHLCQEASGVLSSLRTGPPAVAYGDLVSDLRSLRRTLKTEHLVEVEGDGVGKHEGVSESIDAQSSECKDGEEGEDANRLLDPFLAVVLDGQAFGRHTLAALRAIYRLLERGSLLSLVHFHKLKSLSLDSVTKGVLGCKFEQTDVAEDELVEMALADLLGLLIALDSAKLVSMDKDGTRIVNDGGGDRNDVDAFHYVTPLKSETRMEAFTTVFLARNTFVHSPALCYHIEGVLLGMISATFSGTNDGRQRKNVKASAMEDAAIAMLEFLTQQLLHTPLLTPSSGTGGVINYEAQTLHDATRVLCMKLVRCVVREVWGNADREESLSISKFQDRTHDERNVRSLLSIVQDELCLALLIIGQVAGNDVLSLEVLSEVCATIATLWGTSPFLRKKLYVHFEAIINGFFVRALAQLRCRPDPVDSEQYELNQSFDSECEIILESLVDMMCVLDITKDSSISTLEILFLAYDCNMNCPNVLARLFDELCLCCIDGEKKEMRNVPAHLKELCAETLTVGLKCAMHGSALSGERKEFNFDTLRQIKSKKNLMLEGAILFNEKSSKGIKFLVDNNVFPPHPSPKEVSLFLRQGISLGLGKVAVGGYLGEKGKSSNPLRSIPDYERDWFHDQVLVEYCNLFYFEQQSLLGEAQQIDRIIQSFAESCGRQCKETINLNLFSENEKRATDAAYLLAFSIIMLNTDLHNPNIRPDRKMSLDAFVKNNTDYGREITDEGKPLPRDFLEGIYESIKLEEIRTEGEGADGVMTIDQWNDVVIGRRGGLHIADSDEIERHANDMSQEVKWLVFDFIGEPLIKAIHGFWNTNVGGSEKGNNVSLGTLEARLGMDLANEVLVGLHDINHTVEFNKVLKSVCEASGLLRFSQAEADRRDMLLYSVKKQSALIVAVNIALRFGNILNQDSWSAIYGIIFELRDLKLISRKALTETDPDFLNSFSRRFFNANLVAWNSNKEEDLNDSGVFNVVFGSFFSSGQKEGVDADRLDIDLVGSIHGKEKSIIWDESAASDDEEDDTTSDMSISVNGPQFENLLAKEDNFVFYETSEVRCSQRSRVRKRLSATCDLKGLISESRFLTMESISNQLKGLISYVENVEINRESDTGLSLDDIEDKSQTVCVSPASEAFAEVLICEIALKNRDRLGSLWGKVLCQHYMNRLGHNDADGSVLKITSGIEKCAMGLLRIIIRATRRGESANEMFNTLSLLHPPRGRECYRLLVKQYSEGIWRMCADADSMVKLSESNWESILSLMKFCAVNASEPNVSSERSSKISTDDTGLVIFRSLHALLHSIELKDLVPLSVVDTINALIVSSIDRAHSQVAVAALDLLLVLHSRLGVSGSSTSHENGCYWLESWIPVLDCMAFSANCRCATTRQHALSMLADAIIDSHGKAIPRDEIFMILNKYCINLAATRIRDLVQRDDLESNVNEVTNELDLCISLAFKTFLHHLHIQNLSSDMESFSSLWFSLLQTVHLLIGEEIETENTEQDPKVLQKIRRSRLLASAKESATERLQNAVMVLIGYNIIERSDAQLQSGDISDETWSFLRTMKFCSSRIDEWVLLESEGNTDTNNLTESTSMNSMHSIAQ